MKRTLFVAFAILMMMLSFAVVSSAVEMPLRVVVDGEKINFPDAQPFIDSNSRTQVPVRFISDALGATTTWDGSTKTVTIVKGAKTVKITINKTEMYVNGEMKMQDTAPIIVDSRTFVPLRFVSEALEANVTWDGKIRTVYISQKSGIETAQEDTEIKINNVTLCVNKGDIVENINDMITVTKNTGFSVSTYSNNDSEYSFALSKKNSDELEKCIDDFEKVSENLVSDSVLNDVIKYLRNNISITEDEDVVFDGGTYKVYVDNILKDFYKIYITNLNLDENEYTGV